MGKASSGAGDEVGVMGDDGAEGDVDVWGDCGDVLFAGESGAQPERRTMHTPAAIVLAVMWPHRNGQGRQHRPRTARRADNETVVVGRGWRGAWAAKGYRSGASLSSTAPHPFWSRRKPASSIADWSASSLMSSCIWSTNRA